MLKAPLTGVSSPQPPDRLWGWSSAPGSGAWFAPGWEPQEPLPRPREPWGAAVRGLRPPWRCQQGARRSSNAPWDPCPCASPESQSWVADPLTHAQSFRAHLSFKSVALKSRNRTLQEQRIIKSVQILSSSWGPEEDPDSCRLPPETLSRGGIPTPQALKGELA